MNKTQIITEVKALFLKGNIPEALSEIISFFEKEEKYNELENAALQLKSQYSKIQKDESVGLISFDNAQLSYNRIGKGLTILLDRLENDELKSTVNPSSKNKNRSLILISALAVVLIASFFIFKDKIFSPTVTNEEEQDVSGCPAFESSSEFNILLLPFINYGGIEGEISTFENSYRQRFNNFNNKLSFAIDTEIYIEKPGEDINPGSSNEAEQFAQKCTDIVKLVVWGSYEKQSNDKIITTTNYKFLNVGEQFAYGQLDIGENLEQVVISSVSSIATQGSTTSEIEQLLMGIAAHQMGDEDAAIALLENISPPDSASLLLWGMTLADSYLEQGQKEKAIKSYDRVLDTHPDYRFALLNRAMLNFESGNTEAAVEDLDHQLKIDPNDNTALYSRATIYVKDNQLDKAQKDISILESSSTQKQKVAPLKRDYTKKMNTELRKKKAAEKQLEQNPNNLQALNSLSESCLSIGDYQTALSANQKITKIRPENKKAWSNVVYLSKTLNLDYRRVIKRANAAGISNDQLKKFTPGFRTLDTKENDN
jgi:tetratricopeptide (TPR) repeat protein